MKRLSDLCEDSKEAIINDMRLVVAAYGSWIAELEERIPALDAKYHEAALKNIEGCIKAKQ